MQDDPGFLLPGMPGMENQRISTRTKRKGAIPSPAVSNLWAIAIVVSVPG
jgi:hypothetical protein